MRLSKRSIVGAVLTVCVSSLGAPRGALAAPPPGNDDRQAYAEAYQRLTRPTRAELRKLPLVAQAKVVAPCFPVLKGYYCGVLGYRDTLPNYAKLLRASKHGRFAPLGDLPFAHLVRARVAMPTGARMSLEDGEYELSVAELAKIQAIDEVLERIEEGEPVGSTDPGSEAPGIAPRLDDPDGPSAFIMAGKDTRQIESNWCGPATMQMLDWGDDGSRESQGHWADKLGTVSAGTSISAMVRETNQNTRWDIDAGTYIVQSVSSWNADKMWGIHVAHLGDSTPAPIIEHPELLTQYFPYLNFNGDGHFQVGRGYSKSNADDIRRIALFEPWNEADWYASSSAAVTWGPRSVTVARVLAATKANSFENIGL